MSHRRVLKALALAAFTGAVVRLTSPSAAIPADVNSGAIPEAPAEAETIHEPPEVRSDSALLETRLRSEPTRPTSTSSNTERPGYQGR